MGECMYNGTCGQCTHSGLEYVETFEQLTCCVWDTSIVPGWIKLRVRSENDCPGTASVSIVQKFLIGFAVVLCVFLTSWFAYRKIRQYRYRPILHERLPPTSVSTSREGLQQIQAGKTSWEEIELASMTNAVGDAPL